VDQGQVAEVTLAGSNEVRGKTKGDPQHSAFKTTAPTNYPDMIKELLAKGVPVTIKEQSSGWGLGVLMNLAPVLMLLFLWIFMLRQMQTGGNKALSFGK